MNQFTIKDIENLCGIKAHTLRIWEQRYKICIPERKESQHRVYTDEHLKHLLRISFLYHNGYKISKLAKLTDEELREQLQNAALQQQDNNDIYIHQLIEAGIDFDKERFEKVVSVVVLRIGMAQTITKVFYPFLERIGMLWMTNHVIPAQEHFVSNIIRKKIIAATDGLGMNTNAKPTVLVFAPEGEFHEIPLLVANYFLKKNYNRTVYFGSNVTIDALSYYLETHESDYLYAHVITPLGNQGLDGYFNTLCNRFGNKKIVLGGPAAATIKSKYKNVQVLGSTEEMIAFAREKAVVT
jgi:MerR family transcriptional regulator, light-induced transcriptional regulator